MLIREKYKKVGKRALCLVFAFLFSINSFAAVVADNDGSSFITKAEFDSLKNNFQAQIDNYNINIDNKIDDAIAKYLSGVKVDIEPVNLYESIMNATGNNFRFKNWIPGLGVSTCNTLIQLNTTRQYYNKRNKLYYRHVTRGTLNLTGYKFQVQYNASHTDNWDYTICAVLTEAKNSDISDKTAWDKTPGYRLSSNVSYYEQGSGTESTEIQAGNGAVWLYERLPSGIVTLRKYCSTFYPTQLMKVFGHTYKNWYTTNLNDFITRYTTADGLNITSSMFNLVFNMNRIEAPGYWEDNLGKQSETSITTGVWGNQTIYYTKMEDDIDWTVVQFGKVPSSSLLWSLNESQEFTVPTTATTYNGTDVHVKEEYPSPGGISEREVKYNGVKTNYYPVSLTPEGHYYYEFANQYLSAYGDETVYLGSGAPFFKTLDDGQKVKIKCKFVVKDVNGNSVSDRVKFSVSNRQFGNTYPAPDALTPINNQDIDVAVDGTEFETVVAAGEKGVWWINAYAENDGYDVYITDTMFKLSNTN